MVFSSLTFLFIFLPIVLIGNYILRGKLRNIFLLIFSLIFYSWGEPKYIVLMIISILVNWVMGLLIENKPDKSKIFLFIAVAVNLGLLCYFKYFNFIIDNIIAVTKANIERTNIILPIGISFYTFQSISYIVDLYRGHYKAQRNLLDLALYICLFPQLIAGPIVRYADINDQLTNRVVNSEKAAEGIKRFIVGLSKKVIIANTLAGAVKTARGISPDYLSTQVAWMGAALISLYIYFDFSGYSDMAIGLGKILGFDFLENFNYPYVSRSVTEFWRRWHISLSSWFRDYLYIPLGGSRTGNVYLNLFIVFAATGIWHGASWNFVLWGLWNGFFVLVERAFLLKYLNKNKTIGLIYTLIVASTGWVLFEYGITTGLPYIKAMFSLFRHVPAGYYTFTEVYNPKVMIVAIIAIFASMENKGIKARFASLKYSQTIQFVTCVGLLLVSIFMLISGTYNPFIYFRF